MHEPNPTSCPPHRAPDGASLPRTCLAPSAGQQRHLRHLRHWPLAAAAALLVACGGGGGGSAPGPTQPQPRVVSGVAATGAAMAGATVVVVDARGQEVGRSTPVGADGRYSVTLPAEAQAPFVLKAELPDEQTQVSVLAEAPAGSATLNITPITSLVAARLSPDGRPEGLVRQFEQGASSALPTAARIEASKQEVLQIIEPVRQALGDTTDPLTGAFDVGGRGHDKLLDSLAVTIVPQATGTTNIEVTVRTRRDDETPMPAVAFSSNTPAGQLPQVEQGLRREHFGAEGTSARIDALLAEINRCYALPVDERVTSTTVVPRSAALVKEGPCREMYYAADPSRFRDNGAVVGNGAGNGLFTSDVLVFDRPVYEYTRAGAGTGDETPELVVFTVRWTNQRSGASDSMVVHARADELGRLKLFGNQYRYPMSVRPIVLRQTHVRSDSGHMDNWRSGYNLLVANLQQDGQPVFDRVEVVAPVGLERSATRDVFVLRPMTGFTNLRMVGQFLDSRSSQVVWMGGDWVDPVAAETTPTSSGRRVSHPIELDGGGAVWVNDPQGRGWSDERLERLSHKSVWTFRYFLRGNTGDVPDAVQSMTTLSRAPSIREVRQQVLATFSAPTLDWMRAMSGDPQASMFWMSARTGGSGAFPTEPPVITLSWQVPAGAQAPTNVNGFGRTTTSYSIGWEQRPAFDRMVSVPSSQREATLSCVTASSTLRPVLCHDGGASDRYSLMTMFSDFELWAKNLRQVEFTHSHATFIPGTRRTVDAPVIERLNAAP